MKKLNIFALIFLLPVACWGYTDSTKDVHIVSYTQTAETTARIKGVNPGDKLWGVVIGSCASISGSPVLTIYDSSGTATSTQAVFDTMRYAAAAGCTAIGTHFIGPNGVTLSSGLTYTNTGGAAVSFLIHNVNISTNSASD